MSAFVNVIYLLLITVKFVFNKILFCVKSLLEHVNTNHMLHQEMYPSL